ncbi:MAG: DUF262 domain-containing protein [Magnetococcus sp. XQGC-1]
MSTEVRRELAADGSLTEVESEDEGSFDTPFDPDSISIESKVVPMDTLVRRLRQGTINLAPDFQRGFVWDDIRRSRLIESLMLKIPLPMFYVAATKNGAWDVVDGIQRLSTIRDFLLGSNLDENGFTLTGLEFWGGQFNDKTYNKIREDGRYVRIVNNIMETELRFTVINPGTPEEVKRNVFRRINTGGMPLTPQEIRHALYQGESTRFLTRLVESKHFEKAIGSTLNDSRMSIKEIILRFLAFSLRNEASYEPTMDAFLSDTMRLINHMPNLTEDVIKNILKGKKTQKINQLSVEQLEVRFITAMQRGVDLFGRHAFRKSCGDEYRSFINKALFESLANVLADLDENNFEKLRDRREQLHDKYRKLMMNSNFIVHIGRGSTGALGVQGRYTMIREMIHSVLREDQT